MFQHRSLADPTNRHLSQTQVESINIEPLTHRKARLAQVLAPVLVLPIQYLLGVLQPSKVCLARLWLSRAHKPRLKCHSMITSPMSELDKARLPSLTTWRALASGDQTR